MRNYPQAFTYSFSRTYFENMKANLASMQSTGGLFNKMFEDYWKEKDSDGNYKYRRVVDGFDEGIDLRTFVKNVYNGDQQICLTDKIAREMGQAVADVFDTVGLGSIGCSIGQAISHITDKFTDAFGSFICTATAESLDTECARELLDKFKAYRDNKLLTTRKGRQIVRYYQILGPKVVGAINKDVNPDEIYKEVMNNYLIPLKVAVDEENTVKFLSIYFTLMDDMVKKYDIKVTFKFRQWVKEYNGLCKN